MFSFLSHEHTLDHSVFIRICMQEHIQLFGCVCVCFLFQCCRDDGVHLKHAWLCFFSVSYDTTHQD